MRIVYSTYVEGPDRKDFRKIGVDEKIILIEFVGCMKRRNKLRCFRIG
jgi:hypothetical protein